jgi:hypothetical protein
MYLELILLEERILVKGVICGWVGKLKSDTIGLGLWACKSGTEPLPIPKN